MPFLALVVASVLALIAALHFYWAAGGHAGRAAAVPEMNGRPTLEPGPLGCFSVGVLLVLAALILLGRGGVVRLPGPRWLFVIGSWSVGAILALRGIGDFRSFGLFRRVTGTRFARNDTLVYTPLCLLLAVGALCVAWRAQG